MKRPRILGSRTALTFVACLNTLLFLPVLQLAAKDAPFRIDVIDPQHENVTEARVDFVSDRETRTAFTDADGMAIFVNLRSGSGYKVRVAAFGFVTWARGQDGTTEQERPLLVTLRPGVLSCEPHYWIDYDANLHSTIRGTVIDDASGKGVRGAIIQLQLPDEKQPIVTLRSYKNGMFEFPNLAPGRYRLRVVTAGTRYQEPNLNYGDKPVILVVSMQDAPFITIRLPRRNSVEVCL